MFAPRQQLKIDTFSERTCKLPSRDFVEQKWNAVCPFHLCLSNMLQARQIFSVFDMVVCVSWKTFVCLTLYAGITTVLVFEFWYYSQSVELVEDKVLQTNWSKPFFFCLLPTSCLKLKTTHTASSKHWHHLSLLFHALVICHFLGGWAVVELTVSETGGMISQCFEGESETHILCTCRSVFNEDLI